MPTPGSLEEMVKEEAVKEKDEKNLREDWLEDSEIPARLAEHRTLWLELLTELKSM